MPFKHLVKTDDGKYFKFSSNNWIDIGTVQPTKEDYLTHGMNSVALNAFMIERLSKVTSKFSFATYVYNEKILKSNNEIISNCYTLCNSENGYVFIDNDGAFLEFDFLINSWTNKIKRQHINSNVGSVELGEVLYSITPTKVERYLKESEQWDIICNVENQGVNLKVEKDDSGFYCINNGRNEYFDIKTLSWSSFIPPYTNNRNIAVARHGNQIYCITKTQVFVFDEIMKNWTLKTSHNIDDCLSATSNNEVIIIFCKNRIVEYNPKTGEFISKKTGATNEDSCSLLVNKNIYHLNKNEQRNFNNEIFIP